MSKRMTMTEPRGSLLGKVVVAEQAKQPLSAILTDRASLVRGVVACALTDQTVLLVNESGAFICQRPRGTVVISDKDQTLEEQVSAQCILHQFLREARAALAMSS